MTKFVLLVVVISAVSIPAAMYVAVMHLGFTWALQETDNEHQA